MCGPNVLVTSAGGKIPLLRCVEDALSRVELPGRLIVADASPMVLARHLYPDFWQMPRTKDLSLEGFVQECRRRRIGFVIPTRDAELPFFAAAKDRLRDEGIFVMVSSAQAVAVLTDKLEFSRMDFGTRVSCIETWDALPEGVTGRWVVKERTGAGSRDVRLDLSVPEALQEARSFRSPVFQPFLSAERELSIDFYVSMDGRLQGFVPRSRDLVRNGESVVTTTCRYPEAERICERLVSSLDLQGHLVLQVFDCGDGGTCVIECNARFGGASTLAIAAGLDSFRWFVMEASGCALPAPVLEPVATRCLRQIRIPCDRIHEHSDMAQGARL